MNRQNTVEDYIGLSLENLITKFRSRFEVGTLIRVTTLVPHGCGQSVSRKRASKILARLVKAGVLRKTGSTKKAAYWVLPEEEA